ncbi:MAG: branched-chain amino acid transport system permease protein [Parasphingorhabdus sp.]|jgi:branched-chain amino acid transport system permease protein
MEEQQPNTSPASHVGRRPWLPRIRLAGARDLTRYRIPFTRRNWFQSQAKVNSRDLVRQYKLDDKRPWFWIIGLLAALVVPIFVGTNLALTAATTFAMYASINLMWMLVIGTAGIFSLATLAVVGAAAYLSAWMSIEFGLTWPLMLLFGTGVGFIFGIVIGLPALRIDGLYFALLTMGVVELCRVYVVQSRTFGSATGGLYGADTFIPAAWQLKTPGLILGYVATFVLMLAMLGIYRLVNGQRLGLLLATARESEATAEALGIKYQQARFIVFLISSAALGFIGGFYAAYFKGASPSLFSIDQVMLLFAMIVIGGLGRAEGAVVGTGLVVLIDKMFAEYGPIRFIVIGLIMLGTTLYARNGLFGIHTQFVEFRNKMKSERRSERTQKGGEPLSEEATEIHDKDQIYYRRFDKRLRDHLKTLVSPEIIEEHRIKPLGQHSDALERVLHYFRSAGGENKYVLFELKANTQYKIIVTTGQKGIPPRDLDGTIYTDKYTALHAVFLNRVQDLMDS